MSVRALQTELIFVHFLDHKTWIKSALSLNSGGQRRRRAGNPGVAERMYVGRPGLAPAEERGDARVEDVLLRDLRPPETCSAHSPSEVFFVREAARQSPWSAVSLC